METRYTNSEIRRALTFSFSLHVGLVGWMSWHFWSHVAGGVIWTIAAMLFLSWIFWKGDGD